MEYVLPNPDTRPRHLALTPDGNLSYGNCGRGFPGRFKSKTGPVKKWPSPSGRYSDPYALTAVENIERYVEIGMTQNTFALLDPRTGKFQTWLIPSGGGVIRNMMADKEGNF